MRAKSGDAALARRIKELRDKNRLTQERLAELADISLPLVQKLENASLYGSKGTHEKLANALSVSVAYLLYGNGVENSQNKSGEGDEKDPLQELIDDPEMRVFFSANMDKLSPSAKRHIAAILRDEMEDMKNG